MNNADKRSGSIPSAAKRNNKTLVKFVWLILTPEIGMLIPIILICVLTNKANPVFLTWKFFSKILINSIPIGMMALGQALVTLTGDVDLSVGMNGCFAGIMMGVACDRWGLYAVCGSSALGLIVCMLIGLASGALIGAINGLLTSRFKLSSWITTLATQFVCKGLVTTISQGITLDVKALGTKAFKDARPLSLSWLFFIFVLIILLLDIVVRRTSFGYKLRAVGGNPNAATMGGISVNKIRFLAFLRETDGRGCEIVMDSTGAPSLINTAMELVRNSGKLVIPAFYEQELNHVMLDRIIARNCMIIGAAGTPNIGDKVLSLLERGRLDLRPMLTDRFPFSQVEEAFAAVTERNESRIKVMVDFE